MYTEQLTQALSIAATPISPQTLNNSTASTGNSGVDMSRFKRVLFIIMVGNVTSGGSLSAKVQESLDGSTSWTDIANSSITAITTSSKVATIEVRADEMTKRYARCTLTETGSQNVVCACVGLGGEAVLKPASNQDVSASVAQRLVV